MRRTMKGKGSCKITDTHIQILESIPGWKWAIYVNTLEERCHELKKWVEENGRMPVSGSSNANEHSLANLISDLRKTKKGKGDRILTKEHVEIVESIPNWFWEVDRNKTRDRCCDLKKWAEENKRFPSQHSKDKEERSLGMFVNVMRRSKRGKGNYKITEEHVQILESIQGWFWTQDKDKTINKCYELKKWVEKNGRMPRHGSDDKEERDIGRFGHSIRQAKKGKGCYRITNSHIQILESIPGWRWCYENRSLDRCHILKKWVEENGRLPSSSSKDKEEKSFGALISTMKMAKKGKVKNKITEIHIQLLESIPGWKW